MAWSWACGTRRFHSRPSSFTLSPCSHPTACACWRTSVDAREALGVIAGGRSLTRDEAESTMSSVMAGDATPAQLAALLAALHMRGETADEIAGFATAMRAQAVRVAGADGAVDGVGTGGGPSKRTNTSTAPPPVT